MNGWFECNDIVVSVYSHYPINPNAKSCDTKDITFSIRWFCIRIKRVMSVYGNYDVIAFRSYIQIFTVYGPITPLLLCNRGTQGMDAMLMAQPCGNSGWHRWKLFSSRLGFHTIAAFYGLWNHFFPQCSSTLEAEGKVIHTKYSKYWHMAHTIDCVSRKC